MDAMAADGACSTVSHRSRLERPHLARPVQSVSHRARQPSADRVAVHEQNPVRAHLVARVEDCRWSSARVWSESLRGPRVEAGPIARPAPWLDWVNGPLEEMEVQRVRQSVKRNAPFGSETWTVVTAALLGLDASLRPIGRPQKLVET